MVRGIHCCPSFLLFSLPDQLFYIVNRVRVRAWCACVVRVRGARAWCACVVRVRGARAWCACVVRVRGARVHVRVGVCIYTYLTPYRLYINYRR